MRVPRRAPTWRRRRRRPPRRPRITVTATGTTARRTARRHRPDGRPIGDDLWHGGGCPARGAAPRSFIDQDGGTGPSPLVLARDPRRPGAAPRTSRPPLPPIARLRSPR